MRGRPEASEPWKRTPTVSSSRTLPPEPRKRRVSIAELAHPAFVVRARGAEHQRPHRPRGRRRALIGRSLEQLDRGDRRGALSVRGSHAVRAGVASPEDHDVLARREDLLGGIDRVPGVAMVLLAQELHREVDPREIPALDREIARLLGPAAEQDGVEAAAQLGRPQIDADVDARLEARRPPRASARCAGRSGASRA